MQRVEPRGSVEAVALGVAARYSTVAAVARTTTLPEVMERAVLVDPAVADPCLGLADMAEAGPRITAVAVAAVMAVAAAGVTAVSRNLAGAAVAAALMC
jgi:hypothetical protein